MLPAMTTIRSTRVVFPDGVRPATLEIDGGVFVGIGEGSAELDYGEHVIMPGLVDSHVHVNEPGRTDWEGFLTATQAALAGGTTTIVDMPLNSIPPTTTVAALEEKRSAADGKLSADVAFWGGVVPGSEGDIDGLIESGVCGFKVFLTDSGVPEYPPMEIAGLRDLHIDVPLLVHAEATDLLGAPGPSYAEYVASRPPEAEAEAIRRVSGLDAPVHILHVSSAEGVEVIARADGVTGETCPHYLTFSAADVTGLEFKCAPPIRDAEHREALWDGLRSGTLSMVVSDHSPSPPSLKQGDFATAWGGISSVQLRLCATWTGASERQVPLTDLARWLAAAPAHLAGLSDRKGSIATGKDADYVVFDPDGATTVRGADLYHCHPLTPYEGMRLRGRVVETSLGSPARMLVRT
jgi:allantoinase